MKCGWLGPLTDKHRGERENETTLAQSGRATTQKLSVIRLLCNDMLPGFLPMLQIQGETNRGEHGFDWLAIE